MTANCYVTALCLFREGTRHVSAFVRRPLTISVKWLAFQPGSLEPCVRISDGPTGIVTGVLFASLTITFRPPRGRGYEVAGGLR